MANHFAKVCRKIRFTSRFLNLALVVAVGAVKLVAVIEKRRVIIII